MIYVCCIVNVESGGPELLHQLVYVLNLIGREAKMVYLTDKFPLRVTTGKPLDCYAKYGCQTEDDISVIDREENVVILPELAYSLLDQIQNAVKVAWWLSVDGYRDVLKVLFHYTEEDLSQIDKIDCYGFRNRRDVMHLAQSHYALDFLRGTLNVPTEYMDYLSDYINDIYLADNVPEDIQKQDIVLYNPKKGGWRLDKIMEVTQSDFTWIPLINMTRERMRIHMLIAKVYVDFGNHPGKDRIPREAAVSGCCVITGMRGAAAYYEDVPIPPKYKIDDRAEIDVEQIKRVITDVFENYEMCTKDFEDYRKMIRGEKEAFVRGVIRLFT